MSAPDFHAMTAREVHHLPDDWQPRIYESLDRNLGFQLTGAVPIGFYSRGPRKGMPKFPPKRDLQRVVITTAELDACKVKWERETGLCHCCGGSGETVRSVSASGTTYRACSACNGSGAALHVRKLDRDPSEDIADGIRLMIPSFGLTPGMKP